MKLPNVALDLTTVLAEFDVWITPSLGEIRDTERFREELEKIVRVFDALAAATGDFQDVAHCSATAIADTIVRLVSEVDVQESYKLLEALAAVLFLVTGKSDNNSKCQLPLFLRDQAKWDSIPVKAAGQKAAVKLVPLPRELKAAAYMMNIARLGSTPEHQRHLLREFARFILSDDSYVAQLWAVGRSYVMLKAFSRHRDLLTPLVVFQVRGSVSASGGHGPEARLRQILREWGLTPSVDYNTTDVIIGDGAKATTRKKTRAYDFVLPYKAADWQQRLFVQCQFYAGDSGSVSHKNVDQTTSSRRHIGEIYNDARFVEYLDGAGYFSSLNGDLKTLLSMSNTASFFQIRSAPIRLRRELQQIGFLVPLDAEHAILSGGLSDADVTKSLVCDGYEATEVQRVLAAMRASGSIQEGPAGQISLAPERRIVARRYLLLDITAQEGVASTNSTEKLSGCLIVPGYGPFHGLKLDVLAERAIQLAPELKSDWSSPEVILQDIRWLCEQGYAMAS